MSTLNKEELLLGVRNIIDEEFNSNAPQTDWSNKFGIRKYINALIEEGHKDPRLMSYLSNYDNAVTNGAKEYMIFEEFGNGLTKFARGNRAVKNVIESMNQVLATYGMPLVGFQLLERLRDPETYDLAYDAFNNYLNDKCDETKNILYDVLESSIVNNDPAAVNLNILLTDDSAMSPNFIHEDYVSEQEQEELENRLLELRDRKKADEIFGKVKRYLDEQFDSSEKNKLQEKTEYCLNAIANKQGLNLEKHIANIKNSQAASNKRLMEVLDQYTMAIRQGAYEERLYETFIHNLGKYDYLLPVEKTIKRLKRKINENKEQITLTKLLEEMKDDHSSFIYVDLIQEDVARYVKEPNAINRVQLRNALMPYASDPYINEMFNIIYSDNTRRGNELQETAMNIKDQIKLIRENATVSNIYTPVQYIKENECVFNVNGQFYVKKGNNILSLDDSNINSLDEKFVELCQLVNNPFVTINDDNTITLATNSKVATIYEGCVDILGHKETKESLRDLRGMCMKYDDYDTNFYIMCSCLLENFNNIAKVDWAKHITLNENENISADLFKLDNNIFLSTHDESLNQHTFYRNINPIFCKNKLNEHMGINVSSMFNDLLPNQDKIILKLNETNDQYQDSINQYEEMIQKLKDSKENASEKDAEELDKAIKDAETTLSDIKDEYKNWLKETKKATGKALDNSEEDDDEEDGVTTEEPNTPIDDDDVEAATPELSQPLTDMSDLASEDDDSWIEDSNVNPDEEDEEGAEDDDTLSDDEFANFFDDEYEEGDETEIPDYEEDGETETEMPDYDEDDETETEMPDYDEDGETETEMPDYEDNDMYADTEEEDKEEFLPVELGDEETEEPTDNALGDELSDEDVFGNDSEEPAELEEPVEDEEPAELEEPVEDAEIDDEEDIEEPAAYQSDFSYKIANVMFNENLKEGTKEKSGSVIVIVPMVDGAGRKYVENQTVEFYLSDDNTPILDNEPMTNELYQAVIDAIVSHPDYQTICDNGQPASVESPTIDPLKQIKSDDLEDADWEEEYMRDGNEEDRGYYGPNTPEVEPAEYEKPRTEEPYPTKWNFREEENIPLSEKPERLKYDFGFSEEDFDDEDGDEDGDENVIIPTYKDGDTEVEFPAANVDNTLIPESYNPIQKKKKLSIKPVFKSRNGKRFF